MKMHELVEALIRDIDMEGSLQHFVARLSGILNHKVSTSSSSSSWLPAVFADLNAVIVVFGLGDYRAVPLHIVAHTLRRGSAMLTQAGALAVLQLLSRVAESLVAQVQASPAATTHGSKRYSLTDA